MASEGNQRVVVIAMDGSANADYALDWYSKNVHKDNDRVVLIHCPEYHAVIHHASFMADPSIWAASMKEEEEKVKKFLEVLGQKLKDHGFGGRVKSITGEPGEVIVEAARQEKADLIVTGCRGMGKFRRTIIGSISDYVLHHSHVPVVVCKHKDHDHH